MTPDVVLLLAHIRSDFIALDGSVRESVGVENSDYTENPP
jgi:hypothetical protein